MANQPIQLLAYAAFVKAEKNFRSVIDIGIESTRPTMSDYVPTPRRVIRVTDLGPA